MIETLLSNLDTLLLLACAGGALGSAALMLVLRQPMRVAMALITAMLFLGAIYGLLGVHFVAAFQVLIHRYAGQSDLLVGSPSAGRGRARLSGVVGYFVNPVVLRSDASADPSFSDFTSHEQLPNHVMRQVRRFFEDYKVLEHKQVVVEDLLGPEDALKIILECMELYRKLRRGELTKK